MFNYSILRIRRNNVFSENRDLPNDRRRRRESFSSTRKNESLEGICSKPIKIMKDLHNVFKMYSPNLRIRSVSLVLEKITSRINKV